MFSHPKAKGYLRLNCSPGEGGIAGAGDFYSRSEVNVADALNLAEKQAILEKEQGLITALNRVLAQLGYEVVATTATSPAARRGWRRGRKPGRPRKATPGQSAKTGDA